MENTDNFDFEYLSDNFGNLAGAIGAGKSCSVFGVQNSLRPALLQSFGKKTLYLTSDNVTAAAVCELFRFSGKRCEVFPAVSDTFLYKRAVSTELFVKRTLTIFKILTGEVDYVVAPIGALLPILPDSKVFRENILSLCTGETILQSDLEAKLIRAGYRREELISQPGQFSKRGEIFDIFPINSDYPFRIDFFDNEIESIKIFDIVTQKGTKQLNKIVISPCVDLFLSDEEAGKLITELEKIKKSDGFDANTAVEFSARIEEISSRIEIGDRGYSLDVVLPLVSASCSSLFDYFDEKGVLVAVDECKHVYDTLCSEYKETQDRIKNLTASGAILPGLKNIFSADEIISGFKKFTCIGFMKITNQNRLFDTAAAVMINSSPSSRFAHNLKDFSLEMRMYLLRGYKIFVFAGSEEQARNAREILLSHDIDIGISDHLDFMGESAILKSGYETGFILPDEKIYVVGTYDIFPKKQATNRVKSNRSSIISIPKVGDYVVHEYHGIGICEGVTKLTGNFGTKDYLVIRYRDGDKLYVPTTSMDMLSRFSGAETPKKLSKIGGQDFSAVKNRVKESLKKLAFNLLELYAKRDKIRGFAFSEDNELQREFENSFPYTETEDQLSSIQEIKKDMEKPKVMDRLLCGDVGFGKTEVALRACFKAIMDRKQVAFVAPTTILSEQHYNTARSRMYDFGVTIEVLNRFKSKTQTKKILQDIKDGKVDLVCGTHRIFSKDVEFKNLGLIVLDEEQKFGVEDKEKLKHKYPEIDCLTLSATPIPRTLNMSLTGIRDISVISTPPSERLPIQTFVTEYSDSIVRDATARELSRGGQVFILYNSVEKIYMFAEKIRKLCPDAAVSVAHGQMTSHELENAIYDFYNKKSDILVCTTIIENGVDIENANTLIVIDSDRLGLSQLYQIRGRVGRGARMAYAYFTYAEAKVLSEEAYKRLDAMSEFCEFGSGFKLAMRDLEIRGGGDILGAEQSGHLQKIGYDMYTKLLAQTIRELKGEKEVSERETLIRVAIDAYVPDTYIATSEDRMVVYQRISEVSSTEDAEKLKGELFSVYGEIPKVVSSLIDIALVRHLAQLLNASQIISSGAEVDIVFDEREDIIKNKKIGDAMAKTNFICSLDFSSSPMIRFFKKRLCSENLKDVKIFLLEIKKIYDISEKV